MRSRALILIASVAIQPTLCEGADFLWAEQPPASAVSSATGLVRGMQEWGLLAGGGFAHHIWGGRADRQFLAFGARMGRVLSQTVGTGLFRGNFEVALDVIPVFVMFQEQTTYAFSFTLLFRHYLAPERRLRPYVSFGAGTLISTRDIPPGTTRLNFTPQAGLGLAYFVKPRLAYLTEYRIHHISNAGLASPNPGVNSSYLQFGVSIFR